MQKENSNAVKNAILIAAAQKLIALHFSTSMDELPGKATDLFETFMLTEFSNDLEHRTAAYDVLLAVRDITTIMSETNLKLAQNV